MQKGDGQMSNFNYEQTQKVYTKNPLPIGEGLLSSKFTFEVF